MKIYGFKFFRQNIPVIRWQVEKIRVATHKFQSTRNKHKSVYQLYKYSILTTLVNHFILLTRIAQV